MKLIGKDETILVVDDEANFLYSVDLSLRGFGFNNVITISESHKVLPVLAKKEAAAILLDLNMPGRSGMELLGDIKEDYPHIPVIVITATNEVETAVNCMHRGALDYLIKPLDRNRLLSSLTNALERKQLQYEVEQLKNQLLSSELIDKSAFSHIITKSSKMVTLFKYAQAVAVSQKPVLITGETGTGKELMARAVHAASGKEGKFIAVNLAGLDDNMFSDTLFGHTRSAYTGALEKREGLIAQADGGTLFLDEIGDLKESSQVKLLRLLEDGNFYALGSDDLTTCNARIVLATNRNLEEMVSATKFRKDLYFRIKYHHIDIPPLREHKEDILPLLNHYLELVSSDLGKKKPAFPPELLTLLSNYSFPGNVRELLSMIGDAVSLHQGGILSMASFKEKIKSNLPNTNISTFNHNGDNNLISQYQTLPTLKEIEASLITEALKRADNNQSTAATMLGITRQALNKRLSKKREKSQR